MPLTTITAAAVMHDDPTTISADASVQAALNAILSSCYECAIVLDDQRHPIGIATDGDLIRRLLANEVPSGPHLRRLLANEVPSGPHLRWLLESTESVLRSAREIRRGRGQRVADLMSSPPISVTPDETLQRVAELFVEHEFKQLPVVSDGVLIGLIRLHDVVALIVRQHDDAERALGGSPG